MFNVLLFYPLNNKWLLGRSLLWHLGCFMFYPLNNVLWEREMFLIFYCFII